MLSRLFWIDQHCKRSELVAKDQIRYISICSSAYFLQHFFLSRFSLWLNQKLVFDKIKVPSKWFMSKGTFGLGCNSGITGCYTFYDNIKITKYVPTPPTVYLGKIFVKYMASIHFLI